MRCKTCNRANLPNVTACLYCGELLNRSPKASARTSSSLPYRTVSEGVDSRRLKKVFLWTFVGLAFWGTLSFAYGNLGPGGLILWAVNMSFAAALALISTLIYWGVKEFLKRNADTVLRADAAELENAELRRKVDELSRKSED